MTDAIPSAAISRLHLSLRDMRLELERTRALAGVLAEALEAEVDLHHGARNDDKVVRRHTGEVLHEARQRGLL